MKEYCKPVWCRRRHSALWMGFGAGGARRCVRVRRSEQPPQSALPALPLPPALLRELRAYWPSHGNSHLLFPNRKGTAPFCEDSLRRAFKDARDRHGVGCRSC